ncbi:MAG: tRNA (adenosine(37)-N6)-threonylcarbamoyltransferase complex dimerization subunit type 1 TsaB [Acidobacteriia bacterium]|nr:tRNA (adenosine(37)-N6)-threonylcarbamoyltransferase complex dimerization subunit type 1 TsaB [Terriglobia bacterium]
MILLSLDTCDARGSVCLLRDGVAQAVVVHETAEDYSSWLIPAIQRVLTQGGVSLVDVEVYAVSAGPGSFTGLRIGLTTVKALAELYSRRVAAVSRLEAIASEASGGEWIAALVNGRRGEVYAGVYRREGERVVLQGEESVAPVAEFVKSVQRAIPGGGVCWATPDQELVVGTAWWAEREAAGDRVEEVTAVLAPRIGQIGYVQAQAGKLVDVLALDANYIRRSDAERSWKDARGDSQHAG